MRTNLFSGKCRFCREEVAAKEGVLTGGGAHGWSVFHVLCYKKLSHINKLDMRVGVFSGSGPDARKRRHRASRALRGRPDNSCGRA